MEVLGIAGAALSVIKFSESVAELVSLVVNFPGDLEKVKAVVLAVKSVAESVAAAEAARQFQPKHEAPLLEGLALLEESVEAVQAMCKKCQTMWTPVRVLRTREMARSLNLIIERAEMAMQTIGMQQNQLVSGALEELGASVGAMERTVLVAIRGVEERLDELEQQLADNHSETREGQQRILRVLLFMLQGHPAYHQVQQLLQLQEPPVMQRPPRLLLAQEPQSADPMDALLQQLTQLHDLPQQEQRDATLLRRSITIVRDMQQGPQQQQQQGRKQGQGQGQAISANRPAQQQVSMLGNRGSGRLQSPTPPAPQTPGSANMQAPHPCSSSGGSSGRAASPGTHTGGTLYPTIPVFGSGTTATGIRATPLYPAISVCGPGTAAAGTAGWARVPAAAPAGPTMVPSVLTPSHLTGSSNSGPGLPADILTLLQLAKQQPDHPKPWQALGEAVQLTLTTAEGTEQYSLCLKGQGLGDMHMQALAQWSAPYWPMLRQLDLSKNSLGPVGAEFLADALQLMGNLEVLNLDGNQQLGDAAVTALPEAACRNGGSFLPNLHTLQLRSTGIGDAAAVALSCAAPQWPKLVLLGLGDNRITDEGAQGLIQTLKTGRWPDMLQLDLQGNAFLVLDYDVVVQLPACVDL